MNPVIKILIAEHDENDLEMIDTELKRGGFDFVSEIVKNEPDYRIALKTFIPDIILCDFSFPSFDGPAAFRIKEEFAPDTPFILISGAIGEDNSIELIKNGVTDFVLKDKMFTLNTKLLRALKEVNKQKEKSRTELDLKQSEARLVKSQEIAKIGSWETALIDLQVKWSEETYKIFEVDRQDFQVTHAAFLGLIHPDDAEEVNLAFQRSFNCKSINTIEHRIITPSGLLKHVEECWQIFCDDQGKPTTATGTCQDVTERKNNQAAINKASIEKNMVLESIDDGFFALDIHSLVTYWNRKAENLLGAKKEDILGKNIQEIFADGSSAIFYDNYQKAIKENITVRFEGFFNQTNKWFAVSAFGSENGLSVYFKDITASKTDEKRLKESEMRYRQIVKTAQEGIWLMNENNEITFVNNKICELLGYNEAEIIGRTILSFKPVEEQKKALVRIERRKKAEGEIYESKFITKSGRLIWVNISTNPVFNDNGSYTGRLAMITDITERKRAEQERDWLLSNSEESFILLNMDLDILSFNKQFHELYIRYFGVVVEQGHSILDYVQPEMIDHVKDIYSRVLKGAEEYSELEIPLPDGMKKHFALKYKPAKDGQKKIIGAFVSAIDITERRKAEQQLIIQEKRYRALVENGADGVVILSPEGKLQYASPTIENYWDIQKKR
jgi:PAS domain S-box-containing protein